MPRTYYTPAEQAYLAAHYATAPKADIMAALPARTWAGIQKQACKLGVAQRPITGFRARRVWSDEHLVLLQQHYPAGGSGPVAALTGLTHRAVRLEANRRKIAYTGPFGFTRNPYVAPPKQAKPPKPIKVAPRKAEPVVAVKRNPVTPNLNQQKEARKRAEQAAKKAAGITAEEVKRLPYDHPGRLAYMLDGRAGWQQWLATQPL